MELRSTLSKVRGRGLSTEGGVGHWWAQRITAIALVPLILWFVVSALSMVNADHATFVAWAGEDGNPVLLIMLTIAVYHHGQIGMQVIIEDYIHHEAVRFVALIGVKLGAVFLAIFTIFSIAKLAFGG